MKNFLLVSFFFIVSQIGLTQLTISDALKLNEFEVKKYSEGDFGLVDSMIDVKNNYIEFFAQGIGFQQTICQAKLFHNLDGTALLVITGLLSDEQCEHYRSYFFEITASGNEIIVLDKIPFSPELTINSFLKKSKSIQILEKYLPVIKDEYLGENGTMEDVLNEIYDIHYTISISKESIRAGLSICDYIPRNLVEIAPEDWKIIENDFQKMNLVYNKKKKMFLK